MTTATATTQIPTGTWNLDRAHSTATFAVQHAGLAIFRGGFKDIDAALDVSGDGAVLTGAVKVESIDVDDENIRPHLLSPEFFDAERNPEVTFRSTEFSVDDEEVMIAGELSLAGSTQPVRATGSVRGPVAFEGIGEKIALTLDATIDRTDYGMAWQMQIPGDGGDALANDVSLRVELELLKEA